MMMDVPVSGIRKLLQDQAPASSVSKKTSIPLILGIAGGALCIVLVCLFLAALWWWYSRPGRKEKKPPEVKPTKKKPLTEKQLSILSEKAKKVTHLFNIKDLQVATDNFSDKNVIGEGGFGLVYKGTLFTGHEVAIKYAHKDAQQGLDEFYNEVELLSKVHHKYLVDLIGYCDEAGEQLLVYEFVPNGNLFEHLSGQRTPALTWRQRVQIAICCAKALAHLHEGCSPPIIHRDIKPSNILLDTDYMAKVCDFGLSKTGPVGGATHVSTGGVKGTPGYLDPYYYLSWHLGAYSDVYSFGVILLQLVTSKPAVNQKAKIRGSCYTLITHCKDCLRQGMFETIVDSKLRIQGYNREIMMKMVKLGLRCTGEAIKERPSMKTIYKELEEALETLGNVPSITGSPDSSFESIEGDPSLSVEKSRGTATGAEHDDDFHLYSNIFFDGRSSMDIKNLDVDIQSRDHSPEVQGQESISPPSSPPQPSESYMSKGSQDISINSPDLRLAKQIT